MAAQGFLLIASFILLLMILARPLGTALATMINDAPLPGLASIERGLWRAAGIRSQEMNWYQYLFAILLFNALGLLVLFTLLMFQGSLPLNPQHLPGLSWDLALNTAVSFVSNTNWQAYAGESTLSYLSQMAGLTVQNFLSAATGHRGDFCLHPRLVASAGQHPWQRLGRSHPHYPMAAAADFTADRRVLYSAGRAAKLSAVSGLHHAGRRASVAANGAGRFAGSDQNAGY